MEKFWSWELQSQTRSMNESIRKQNIFIVQFSTINWHLVCSNEYHTNTNTHAERRSNRLLALFSFDGVLFFLLVSYRFQFEGHYFSGRIDWWENISSVNKRLSHFFFLSLRRRKKKTYVWLFSSLSWASFRSTKNKSVILLGDITSSLFYLFRK